MKTVIIAVRDQKSNTFTQPVTVPTKGVAIRSWGDELSDEKNAHREQSRHPEDFSLWVLGEYDDTTGEITPQRPEQLAVASDLKR